MHRATVVGDKNSMRSKVHDYDNCFLKHHLDRNNDPLVKWKDSSSGKAFEALNPPGKVLP
jgi:hypothetical protein